MSKEAFEFVTTFTAGEPQCPDLLVYAPDRSDWFFVEVKGPRDRLRPKQRDYFDELTSVTGRPWFVARLKEMPSTA